MGNPLQGGRGRPTHPGDAALAAAGLRRDRPPAEALAAELASIKASVT